MPCRTALTKRRARCGGFTLVELLVAIAVMAMLAVMAWRGLQGMTDAQNRTRVYGDDVSALQAALAQWNADLDAVTQLPPVGGLDFDGRVLRLTRQYPYDQDDSAPPGVGGVGGVGTGGGSIRVIAWGARTIDGHRMWLRWQSAPLRTRAELRTAWEQAALWGQNPTEELRRHEVVVAAIDDWQVFYYRNNAWTSPLSTATGVVAGVSSGQAPLPDGVRLVLNLSSGQAVTGVLTRDWVRPELAS
ncbi:MAG: type II secretion system protein [Burkholderiaceae bacterium]